MGASPRNHKLTVVLKNAKNWLSFVFCRATVTVYILAISNQSRMLARERSDEEKKKGVLIRTGYVPGERP